MKCLQCCEVRFFLNDHYGILFIAELRHSYTNGDTDVLAKFGLILCRFNLEGIDVSSSFELCYGLIWLLKLIHLEIVWAISLPLLTILLCCYKDKQEKIFRLHQCCIFQLNLPLAQAGSLSTTGRIAIG